MLRIQFPSIWSATRLLNFVSDVDLNMAFELFQNDISIFLIWWYFKNNFVHFDVLHN